jgi:hypothetical protein
MRTTTLIAALIPALFGPASANFHIGAISGGGPPWYAACPSNYLNCDCVINQDRLARISNGNPLASFFQSDGPCGGGLIDYYKRGDGSFEMYSNGGNGERIGECYNADADMDCTFTTWVGLLVCYTYICGS